VVTHVVVITLAAHLSITAPSIRIIVAVFKSAAWLNLSGAPQKRDIVFMCAHVPGGVYRTPGRRNLRFRLYG